MLDPINNYINMRTFISLITFSLFSLSYLCTAAHTIKEPFMFNRSIMNLFYHNNDFKTNNNSQEFESFLMQFDLFEKEQLDKPFFLVREQRKTEAYYPEISKSKYSSFIPYDNQCDCEKEELYYSPCYRIETDNFHIVSFRANCDIPIKGYPFSSGMLVTYDKMGNIIDYEIVGIAGDDFYNVMESTIRKYEFVCTQYSFYSTNSSPYTGKCDVSIYKVTINDNGTIDNEIIRNYTDNITLSID